MDLTAASSKTSGFSYRWYPDRVRRSSNLSQNLYGRTISSRIETSNLLIRHEHANFHVVVRRRNRVHHL